MLARELEGRERSERERLLRHAGFPVPKFAEGFDWSGDSGQPGAGRYRNGYFSDNGTEGGGLAIPKKT